MCIIELYILARDFMIIDEKNGWINDYDYDYYINKGHRSLAIKRCTYNVSIIFRFKPLIF